MEINWGGVRRFNYIRRGISKTTVKGVNQS